MGQDIYYIYIAFCAYREITEIPILKQIIKKMYENNELTIIFLTKTCFIWPLRR
jgi:hypothetical protein